MKLIAIPTRDGMVDDHFGHCAYYTVVTLDEQNQVVKQERLDSPEGCGCKSNIASVLQEMGITLMLAGNMGMGAYNKLSAHGIAVIRGCQGKVDDILKAYRILLNPAIITTVTTTKRNLCISFRCSANKYE